MRPEGWGVAEDGSVNEGSQDFTLRTSTRALNFTLQIVKTLLNEANKAYERLEWPDDIIQRHMEKTPLSCLNTIMTYSKLNYEESIAN
jgi:hypothetical protein